jgi:hypothetical protein
MEQLLISPLVLLAGAILALAGLVIAVRVLPLYPVEPSAQGPLRGRLYRAFLALAIIVAGVALPLLGVAWARIFQAPPRLHVWGLLALGGLQVAIGVVLFAIGHPEEGMLPAASKLFQRWVLPAFVLLAGLAWVMLGLAAAISPAATAESASPDTAPGISLTRGAPEKTPPVAGRSGADEDDGRQVLIGVVRGGEFYLLAPAGLAGLPARLTGIAMQESVAPETKEIDLSAYEGSAILVRGRDGGGWIYEAEVVDQGGPLLTEIAEQVFR